MQKNDVFNQLLGDADFQASLLDNPRQALHKAGVDVPASTEVKVVRNSKDSMNLVVPVQNSSYTVLSDDDLTYLSAGEIIFAIIAVTSATILVGGATAAGILAS